MKLIKEFMTFTNLKGQMKSLLLFILVFSFLYCSAYTLLDRIIYYIPYALAFYLILYIFVILFGYIHMIVIHQFLKRKRGNEVTNIKSCRGTMILVQSCFFLIMSIGSLLSYFFMINSSLYFLQYPLTIILVLLLILYIPWQLFAVFEVLDGNKNPIFILKLALFKIKKHYQSVFYSFLFIALIGIVYRGILDVVFDVPMQFIPASAVMDVMLKSNPFLMMFEFFGNIMDSFNLVFLVMISFIYGIIMSIVLCFYYMFMICVYDEDISV